MNDKKILFIHIPKNVGNSIHRNLIDLNFNITFKDWLILNLPKIEEQHNFLYEFSKKFC